MAIRMPRIIHAKQFLKRSLLTEQNGASNATDIPKGCFAVYVGECEKKRHMIPVAYLSKSLFQDLLIQAEEEYGFEHPMGGITIPCTLLLYYVSIYSNYRVLFTGGAKFIDPFSGPKIPSFHNLLSKTEEEFGFDYPKKSSPP